MSGFLCIHGHFYQPPREDPWLGTIPVEASAAPMRHWNERILRESYAPLAWTRRLDAEGRIADILNCYEWMSFNVGPTLMQWMRRRAPEVLARMKEGDANSISRWGHGNAMAQVYHHVIMPLATEEDRALEIRWAIDDFRHHFGRDPEGMWLAECAVDTPTLESLAAQGIRFVVLAPRQARAVIMDGTPVPVNEGSLDISVPYTAALPSGASITIVFYHGGLSQGIAFEGLLRNGENFWQRIRGESANIAGTTEKPLLTLATDGETYGHHFTFGEMALAHVLAQGYTGRDGIHLTNLAAHIAASPPARQVLLHEPSSWSCVHGVERWRSNCGCTDGGHPGWNQLWRGPLREALNTARQGVTAHFYDAGSHCFKDPAAALSAYGEVLAAPERARSYASVHFSGTPDVHDKAWKLLAMQEQSLASFASCAWFFDDIARIEPENGMTYALRAMDLVRETGGPDLLPRFLALLEGARSNREAKGSGKDVFEREVMSRRDDAATLCLLTWIYEAASGIQIGPGMPLRRQWPAVSVEMTPQSGETQQGLSGTARIRAGLEDDGSSWSWRFSGFDKTWETARDFLPLADAEVTVQRDDGSVTATRRVRDLSRPMRDTLISDFLERKEQAGLPGLMASAANAASLLDVWEEAQRDVPAPEVWHGLLPYMAVPAMCGETLTDEQRDRIRVLFTMHLSDTGKRLAGRLLINALLAALQTGQAGNAAPDDGTLAVWVRRAKALLPEMDWWSAQNLVWKIGHHTLPSLARELHFR